MYHLEYTRRVSEKGVNLDNYVRLRTLPMAGDIENCWKPTGKNAKPFTLENLFNELEATHTHH